MDIGLNDKQIVFLNQYFKNPILPFSQYSKLTSISQVTIKNYYDALKDGSNLIGDHFKSDQYLGMRIHSDVSALISVSQIGLVKYFVFVEIQLGDDRDLIKTMQFLPFLQRIVEIMIPVNLFVLEFDIPYNFHNKYVNLFKTLEQFNILKVIGGFIFNQLKRSRFNFKKLGNWNASSEMPTLMEYFSKTYRIKKKVKRDTGSIDFDYLDLQLIRELQINAHLSLTNIARFHGKDISTLSRRINSIKESYISDYTVSYNLNWLSHNEFLVAGSASKQVISTIETMIDDNIFWFEGLFYASELSFVWKIKLSLPEFSYFQKFLSDVTTSYKVYIVKTVNYQDFLNPDNYDRVLKQWILNEAAFRNLVDHIVTVRTSDLSSIGVTLDLGMDNYDINIYSKLESIFLNILDFVDELKKNENLILDEATCFELLRIRDDTDKYMVLSLLSLYGQKLPSNIFSYLSRLVSNFNYNSY